MTAKPGQSRASRSICAVVIGSRGVERIVEIELNSGDRAAFEKSAGAVEGLVEACKKIAPALAK